MFFIVAHHYVVNSGILQEVYDNPFAINSIFMTCFGLWGKTGINCFVMITGWFMCKSQISILKILKILFQVEFYLIVIGLIFILAGYESFTLETLSHFLPISYVGDGFVSGFVLYYLLIPFINILINNLTKRQHFVLLCVLLGIYTFLGSSVVIPVVFNYVTWFCILHILMSYFRFYKVNIKHKTWGWLSLLSILLSFASVFCIEFVGQLVGKILPNWFFVADSNKILALITALACFMWFKDIKINNSKLINTISASTFGVLLIHSSNNSMRQWLWYDTLQNVKHFYYSDFVIHAFLSCMAIYVICTIIDRMRIIFIEKPFFSLLNKKFGFHFAHYLEQLFPNK